MNTFLSFPCLSFSGLRLSAAIGLLAGSCLITTSASAQFGGFSLPSFPTSSSNSSKNSDGCPKGRSKSEGSSVLGGLIGQGLGRAASSAGVSSFFPSAEVAGTLTNAIACRLDPAEQKQAASATITVTRGADGDTTEPPPVGASSSWTSETRENVSGTSTVVARNDNDKGGMQCVTVSDVIIVNGEETTADKRMCRKPGSARYALMA